MKEIDKNIVANMTDGLLIQHIRDAVPDAKDTKRAEDIMRKSYLDRSMLANKQLRAITDTSKFYRRAKAFLLKEIDISFSGTIFSRCNTIEAKNFIKYTREMVQRNRETMEALDALD
jgi:hypothetical protein